MEHPTLIRTDPYVFHNDAHWYVAKDKDLKHSPIYLVSQSLSSEDRVYHRGVFVPGNAIVHNVTFKGSSVYIEYSLHESTHVLCALVR